MLQILTIVDNAIEKIDIEHLVSFIWFESDCRTSSALSHEDVVLQARVKVSKDLLYLMHHFNIQVALKFKDSCR